MENSKPLDLILKSKCKSKNENLYDENKNFIEHWIKNFSNLKNDEKKQNEKNEEEEAESVETNKLLN